MVKPRRSQRTKELESRILLGWKEYVRLPAWSLSGVRAKIDSGALSSAIDVSAIEEIDENRVRFKVVKDRDSNKRRTVEADVVRHARVQPSFGEGHVRIFVRTQVVVAKVTLEVDFGLVDRGRLGCRMLLGRRDLSRFLIDPRRCYLHGK